MEHWFSMEEAAKTWLTTQCSVIPTAQSAVLVLCTDHDCVTKLNVSWPQEDSIAEKVESVANQVIQQGTSIYLDGQPSKPSSSNPNTSIIGNPVFAGEKIIGALAIEVKACTLQERETLQQVINLGGVWLNALINIKPKAQTEEQLHSIFALTATILEQSSFQASATTLATELATKLNCSRVSIGVAQENTVKIHALSHSAVFNKKNDLIKNIETVMVEAFDVQDTIFYSTKSTTSEHITTAHNKLAVTYNSNIVCSVPLINGKEIFGVVTIEKETPDINDDFKKYIETIGVVIGPILALKHKEERPLFDKAVHSFRNFLEKIFGPKNYFAKFATSACILIVAFLSFSTGIYKVSAESHLEGFTQRAIVAPIDGFIKEATVRAGDIVKAGDVLALIDDKDLRIERLKWDGERAQRTKQYRLALASYDRAQARILSAQIQQAEAKVALIEEQIERTKIAAPLDGVVVSGDLSQSLGAPVRRGDDLFEVASLNQYRVILNIDERDIGEIQIGQSGHLVLSGIPGEVIEIDVEKITPVSVTDAGQNYFRVEASMLGATEKLRPGMKGIAKIEVTQRKRIWIWTHKLVNWLRLWTWTLLS